MAKMSDYCPFNNLGLPISVSERSPQSPLNQGAATAGALRFIALRHKIGMRPLLSSPVARCLESGILGKSRRQKLGNSPAGRLQTVENAIAYHQASLPINASL